MAQEDGKVFEGSPAVEQNCREGSCADDHDLAQYGYTAELNASESRHKELIVANEGQRRFGLWSMIGLSCTLSITWAGWFTIFSVGLTDGGPAGSIYGYLFCWLGYLAVVASLGELASMMPTAGGQYHWVHEMSPAKYRKFLSWITGWQVTVAWQADLAAVLYLGGTSVQAVVVLNYPGYEAQRWHATLMMWAILICAAIFNTLLVRLLSLVDVATGLANVAGFFVVIIPILYFGSHASAEEVFARYLSLAGYSDGTAWLVGLITPVFTFLGVDCVLHLSEEIRHVRLTVPRAMLTGVNVQGLLGFGMMVAVFFTLPRLEDIEVILAPVTGVSFIDYFGLVLRNRQFATGLTAVMLVLFMFCAVAVLTTASRITWAFARDNGIPGSSWVRKVHSGSQLPLFAIAVSAVISMLLSLINIGSSVAFNAVVSLTVASFFGSYFVAIALLVWKRLTSQRIDFGPWQLGRVGLAVNGFSLCWLVITFMFSFFPIAVPATAQTMNWSCVLYGFVMLLGLCWYAVRQRNLYDGPAAVLSSNRDP